MKINFGILIISAFFWINKNILAQTLTIKARVLNEQNFSVVTNASVFLDKNKTTTTDTLGFFKIQTTPGRHTLRITAVGFRPYETTLNEETRSNIEIQILLEPIFNQLEQVVVSGSRFEKTVAKEVMSVNVIQPYLISNTNATDLSEVLNRIPGINVVEGQPTIRGGTGFSYNTGSRVTVLLDDMPLLGADIGDARWNFLPIESAEQIEVIKGSGSVLYGSSALNGTVNVRTGWPTAKPQTKFQFYSGIFSNPKRRETIWWNRTEHPMSSGAFYSHKQRWGKFDLVLCGNINAVRSHLYLADSYRGRNYIKTRFRVNEKLNFGINANIMYEEAGRFFLWHNADSGALRPYNDYTVDDFFRIASIDPHLEYKTENFTHNLKFRFYQIKRFVDKVLFPKDNDAIANVYAMDYSVKGNIYKNISVTAGTYNTSYWAVGNVYKGEFFGYTAAVYAQAEYNFKKLSLVAGARNEVNSLMQKPEGTGLLKRFGANYQLGKNTFLRANYSEGYRFPTIGERHVEDRVSDLNVYPNPDLISEKGFTAELGIQQGFKIGNFIGSVDLAFFNQEFDSMIEFRFGQWVKPPPFRIGFKAFNIGQTRASGAEITLTGEGRIGDVLIRTISGYTYSMPVNLSTNPEFENWGNYLQFATNGFGSLDSAKRVSILPYRNRKIGKVDFEATYNKVSAGYGLFYYSIYEKVDEFILLLPGVKDFFSRAGNGDWIHNARFAYLANENTRISFIVNNFTNREYATRPGRMDAPRSFVVQLRVMF
ncbi:MAG: TonB-dependent receptor domain-containing protein [Bacteroidia bacterium]